MNNIPKKIVKYNKILKLYNKLLSHTDRLDISLVRRFFINYDVPSDVNKLNIKYLNPKSDKIVDIQLIDDDDKTMIGILFRNTDISINDIIDKNIKFKDLKETHDLIYKLNKEYPRVLYTYKKFIFNRRLAKVKNPDNYCKFHITIGDVLKPGDMIYDMKKYKLGQFIDCNTFLILITKPHNSPEGYEIYTFFKKG